MSQLAGQTRHQNYSDSFVEREFAIDYAYKVGDWKKPSKENNGWDIAGNGEPEPVYSYHKDTHAYISRLIKHDAIDNQLRSPSLTAYIERAIAEAKKEQERLDESWTKTPQGIEERLNKEPHFIKTFYQKKIAWFKKNRSSKKSNAFLTGTVKKALLRLNIVRAQHSVSPYKLLSAYYRGIWPHLSAMSRPRIKSLANEIASRVELLLNEQLDEYGGKENIDKAGMIAVYREIATEVFSLKVLPPGWNVLSPKPGKTTDDYDLTPAFAALNRVINPEWWERQLWRMRSDWREALLRASNQVHKKAHPYISAEAFQEWKEQKRKNSDFFKSHELIDEEGNTASLEDMVLSSISNPAIRRHELMTRMQGVEYVAQHNGDVGVFYTITCPSKYHCTTYGGRMNYKWNHDTPSIAQKYLTGLWAKIGAKLHRENLRIYGFRVAEPHHDGTPHWHLLLFMHPSDRRAITKIIHAYAIKEDRHELSKFHRERFDFKKIDPAKGSATAYIAKYISKNIDGYAWRDKDGNPLLDDESGKPMTETAKFATAWAARYRIRQYQPIGQPSVTVWRELRKLNNQLISTLTENKQYDPTHPTKLKALVSDPQLDNILAAADAGCWASYTLFMGGVLTPRGNYAVKLAYEEKDEPNIYGEIVERVIGILVPKLGVNGRICTRHKTWKIQTKSNDKPKEIDTRKSASKITDKESLAFLGGFAAPWSSVNNSTVAEFLTKKTGGIDRALTHSIFNFVIEKECLLADGDNIDNRLKKGKKKQSQPKDLVNFVVSEFNKKDLIIAQSEAEDMLCGNDILLNDAIYRLMVNGHRLNGKMTSKSSSKERRKPKNLYIKPRKDMHAKINQQLKPLIESLGVHIPEENLINALILNNKIILSDAVILWDGKRLSYRQAVNGKKVIKIEKYKQRCADALERINKLRAKNVD
ncbi:replication endonuclease [Providencia alcalifaciens]|uniref:replication endonuclease n=2 Tax=Providencia alcalifaciens TaxID=126385 RepID=UPI0012B5FF0A|nr:replication endonuclease [Providencia alcalifaciens]MTC63162.1 replication endonuclease [Providencia alcalifaciens]